MLFNFAYFATHIFENIHLIQIVLKEMNTILLKKNNAVSSEL